MTSSDDAALLDAAGKRALLATLLRDRARTPGPVPLSSAQRRLWLLDRIAPDESTYNVAIATRLRGALDTAALERALREVGRRHAVLRSLITFVDGEPMYVVDPAFRCTLERANVAADMVAAELAARCERPFDLCAAPALRASLLRVNPHEHVLCIVIHHIVTDGWSTSIFQRELSALYDAEVAGTRPTLPDVRATYGDYVQAEGERDSQERLTRGLRYWRDTLADAPVELDLFPLRPAPALRTSRGATTSRTLDAASTSAFARLARARSATPFATLLTAFVTLLHRYCGSRDIVVGTASANRTRSAYEDIVGFFVNTLALRTRIAGDPTFVDVLAHVQAAALEAFEHQAVPFERLVEDLRPQRVGSRAPFVNVMFVLQNRPDALAFGGINATPVPIERTTAKFDLTLQATFLPEGLELSLEYSLDIFEPETAAALLESFTTLLAEVCADCERPISHLPLLDPVATRRQLVTWNDTARPLPGLRVESLFERVAARASERIALVAGDERLSYGELDARANRLARYLGSNGVRPGARVGLCLERGPAAVIGMLAILKAGAAYVPLDPADPRTRLHAMLIASGASVVLTNRRFSARLRAAATSSGVTCLDCDAAAVRSFAADALATGGTGDDCAYVMFTSGSTGTPKGVMVAHRGIERLVIEPNYVSLGASDVVAQASTLSFDASTFEVWGALCNGARLVFVPNDVVLSAPALRECIEANAISVLFLTTALFHQLAREAPDAFGGLAYLVIGGEALGAPSVERVLANGPPRYIVNGYGPTETTTFAVCETVCAESHEDGAAIPIGRPISNTVVRVLDERGALLPAGACGQLYVGGPGVALGYVNDAASTAAKFVRDRSAAGEAALLYATGDWGRYLPDGRLQFLGRLDGQVKLRGFRIEPDELEAALRSRPGVADAAVVVADSNLVAYVTASANAGLDTRELARALSERLPRYMLPAAIVALDALPLTRNGKVDRAALPTVALAAGAGEIADAPTQPGSELHVALAALWKRLLGADAAVGLRADFFALGGHSLLAARLIAEVNATFGTRLPLSLFFEHPTIEDLANALQAAPESLNRAPLVRLNPDGVLAPLTFLHGSLLGGGYYCLELARRLGVERPVHVLRPHGVDGSPLPVSIEAMAREYAALVKTAQPSGPYLLGGYCSGGLVALEIARLLRAGGDEVSNVVLVDAREPVALARMLAPLSGAVGVFAARVSARFRWHARHFRSSASKFRYCVESFARLSQRVVAGSSGASSVRAPDVFGAWQRVTDAYIPRSYDGPITVLTTQDDLDAFAAKPERWLAIAPAAVLHAVPGRHHTCLTEHIEETADLIARAISE